MTLWKLRFSFASNRFCRIFSLGSSNISFFKLTCSLKNSISTMVINPYLLVSNFNKRIKKSKAPAMKKRTHLRAKVQRVLIMKPDSVSTVLLLLKSLSVLWFCVKLVTSRFRLAIVLKPLNKETKTFKKMIALLNGPRINRLGMMINKVHSATRHHRFVGSYFLDYLITTTMSKQKIIYYIHQFLKASESFSLQKISMVFKRVSENKTLTSFFRILITLLIFSYFYSFFYEGSQEFFIFSLGLSIPRFSKNFAVQPQKLILSTVIPDSYFLAKLIKTYGLTLGTYLANYLQFWTMQDNPDGSYFLDYYQDYYNSESQYTNSFDETQNFGSAFSNQEIRNLEDLPFARKNVAKITILGQTVYFEKINHFFNFISFLANSGDYRLTNDPFIDEKKDFTFNKEFKEIVFLDFSPKGNPDVGFFHFNFDRIFKFKNSKMEMKMNTKEKILKDFLKFLKITEIEINYDEKKTLLFFQILREIKSTLSLEIQNDLLDDEKILTKTMSKQKIIYYINQFLKIQSKSSNFKQKISIGTLKSNFIYSPIKSLVVNTKINKIILYLLTSHSLLLCKQALLQERMQFKIKLSK